MKTAITAVFLATICSACDADGTTDLRTTTTDPVATQSREAATPSESPVNSDRSSRIAAKLVSFKTQPREVAKGSTAPGREVIATIQNNSDRPIRSVFANVSYSRSDDTKVTLHNRRIYWAYDKEPGIPPGKMGVSADGRGCEFGDFLAPRGFNIEITEVSEKWILESTLPKLPATPAAIIRQPKNGG